MPHLVSLALLVIVLALCLSILFFQGITGVPPLSSNATEAADVVALLKHSGLSKNVGLKERAIVYELGSGWGSLVIALARAFPAAEIRGIEISPLPYWVARLRTRDLPNVKLKRGNFYDCDLADAHAVTCYLMIKPMPKLGDFLDRRLKPRTPVVSISFWFRDRDAAAVLENSGPLGAAALYYWPARKTGAS
ncbi:MAG: class I SAM-dependent methyltransferase [Beijerinckiaceae bacterium]|nr:class I SAM-dependent methyltransferase [Beijerinckiaceae bacterium]